MGAKEIIEEIERLPLSERMLILEQVLKSIRKNELKERMDYAVGELMNDYRTDKDLTALTEIDFEDFYEAR